MRLLRSLPALPCTLLVATAAAAQQPDSVRTDTAVFRVEGIRVQATRPVTTVGGASAIEISLDSLSVPVAATTEEILREIPALHLRTNSRGEAEITVRGSESRQVAVLVDGVPLTLSWDARTDVSVLPAGAVKDVTFVRGLSSLLHGPNVLGGVVEMKVGQGRSFPARSSMAASAGLDHTGAFGTEVVGETPFETRGGQGVVRVGAGYRDSPGFPLPGGVDEPIPTDDGLRLNTDMNNVNGFAAVRYQGDDDGAWGSLSASTFKAERGIAAELGAEDPRLWRYPDIRRTIMALSGGTGQRDTPWGRGDLEASVGVDLGQTEIQSFTDRGYDEVDGLEQGDSRTLTFRALGDHSLGSRGELRAAFTLSDIFHESTEDGVAEEYEQRLMSLAGETIWRLLDDPTATVETLRLSLGGAWDRGTTPKTGGRTSLGTLDDWGARVGLSALLNDGATLVHAGLSRRGRFPSLRESYSEALDRFVPNPDLRPEHLVSLEGGITTRVGSGDVQVVGFHNRLDGAIRGITLEDGMRMRVNSDELESTGVEILFSQSFGAVAVGGDLTLQKVTLTDPGTALSTEPENMPEQAGRAWIELPLVAGISADAEVEYTGSQFCQDPNSGADVELDGGSWFNAGVRKVWDLSSSRNLASRLETRAGVVNIGDTALYDQCGLPRQGRLFQFQVRVF
ncbi:MAG TPA: TonB-dependent receptor [Longimicrobiales bacterium]|nr:TonB-dependent receptor [Longimicrobiales bacterium]